MSRRDGFCDEAERHDVAPGVGRLLDPNASPNAVHRLSTVLSVSFALTHLDGLRRH